MSKWSGILSKLASEDSCKTKIVKSTFAVHKQRAAAEKCAVATSICSDDSQTMVATDIPKPLQTKCWKKFLPQFALFAPWLGLARNDKILSPVKKKKESDIPLAGSCPSAVQHHNQIQQGWNTSTEEGSSAVQHHNQIQQGWNTSTEEGSSAVQHHNQIQQGWNTSTEEGSSAVQHHNQIQQVSNTSIEEGLSNWPLKVQENVFKE